MLGNETVRLPEDRVRDAQRAASERGLAQFDPQKAGRLPFDAHQAETDAIV